MCGWMSGVLSGWMGEMTYDGLRCAIAIVMWLQVILLVMVVC